MKTQEVTSKKAASIAGRLLRTFQTEQFPNSAKVVVQCGRRMPCVIGTVAELEAVLSSALNNAADTAGDRLCKCGCTEATHRKTGECRGCRCPKFIAATKRKAGK